jgi:uncharacterized phage protein gp47/JayE
MYENVTYEVILQRMLDTVPADIDKREGSVIWNALAPAAAELQEMYISLDAVLNETFADTATRDYLIKRAAERGVIPEPATFAILQGEFNIDVPLGSRFSLDEFNYEATEKISLGVYKLQCETTGAAPNQFLGTLIPIDYIEGLTSAQLTAVLIPGEDEEDTEVFRQRYFNSLETQAFGGNVADYKDKVNLLAGVGGVKVYPVWNGGGTVKLVIIDSSFNQPSATLIDSVQTAVDPLVNQGVGDGLAPIGHTVTVAGVGTTIVDIATTITYQDGWTWADIQASAETVIDDYLDELSATWADNENLIVRISQIETRLLDVAGVLDIANTTINTVASNLTLAADNIPTRGVVSG